VFDQGEVVMRPAQRGSLASHNRQRKEKEAHSKRSDDDSRRKS